VRIIESYILEPLPAASNASKEKLFLKYLYL
jgi:hypothetical protein